MLARPKDLPLPLRPELDPDEVDPSTPAEPQGPVRLESSSARDSTPALIVAVTGAYLLLKWALDGWPAVLDEPVVLRWLRGLAEHPVRAPVALVCIALGLRSALRVARGAPP